MVFEPGGPDKLPRRATHRSLVMTVEIRPVTPDLWPAFEELFGNIGTVGAPGLPGQNQPGQ